MSLQDAYDVVLLPPADQYFSSTEAAANELRNIHTNKGTGMQIWVEGVDSTGEKREYLLATFRRNNKSDIITYLRNNMQNLNLTQAYIDELNGNDRLFEDYCYYPINYNPYNTEYFEADGTAKDGYKLCIANIEGGDYNSCLVFKINPGTGDEQIFYQFKIKAIQDNRIRPGDDYKLRFGISGSAVIAKANDADFVAVYDKKMLWRANLYIDERLRDGSGNLIETDQPNYRKVDWNDLNPWIDDNEWNRHYEGDVRLVNSRVEVFENTYLNSLSVVTMEYAMNNHLISGGQVVSILPFTYIPDISAVRSDNNEENVVAYSFGCNDNPFEFNDELLQQRNMVQWFFSNNNNHHPEWANWEKTTAPNTVYDNYVFPSELNINPHLLNYTRIVIGDEVVDDEYGHNMPAGLNSYLLNNANFPFLPGWALQTYWWRGEHYPSDWENVISAGVDCVGLFQRSTCYDGNRYRWTQKANNNEISINGGFIVGHDINKPNEIIVEDWYDNDRGFPISSSGYSWQISMKDANHQQPFNLHLIKPGDILLVGTIGHPHHVAIIQRVIYHEDANGGVTVDFIDIGLIEATWDTPDINWAKVVSITSDNRRLSFYGKWEIVRLGVIQ